MQQVCALNSSFCVFPLLSHPWAANPPPTPPPNPPTPHVCGPGGAGACCPEDRGSAGSQKHLSVPLPLHCNPAGTALSSAPAVCKCVRMCVCERRDAWTTDCSEAGVRVHECVPACLSLSPEHTILSVTVNSWPYQHGGCTSTSSALLSPLTCEISNMA